MAAISHAKICHLIKSTDLFEGLPDDSASNLAKRARIAKLRRGEVLFMKGRVPKYLSLILSGRIKITSTSPDGHELLLTLHEPGDLAGRLGAVAGHIHLVTATATCASRVIHLPIRDVVSTVADHAPIGARLSQLLAKNLKDAVYNLENVGLMRAKTRLWSRLMQLAQRYGSPDKANGSMRIDHGLSQQNLANSVGLTRVLVNRQLSGWREMGMVETGRGFVVIPDPDGLESHVWSEKPRESAGEGDEGPSGP
ncbi:MAG: hypothetical protein CL908_02725 [Deltaproteobacteria bacterium]|nr:hypothetical protein [Deltaproteobacteria bacterium]